MPPTRAVLDWSAYKGRIWVQTYNVHHVEKALREIEKSVRKWREGPTGGLAVYVGDGDAKDARRREDIEAHEVGHAEPGSGKL